MTSCTVCLKYVLFAFNLALALLACALLGVGVWLKVDEGSHQHVKSFTSFEDPEYEISYTAVKTTADANELSVRIAYGLIALGIILLAVVVLGCLGAHKESSGLLSVYAVLLFVLMVTLVGLGIWAQQNKNDIDDLYRGGSRQNDRALDTEAATKIHHAIGKYRKDAKAKEFIDRLQTKFSCCGGRGGRKDYTHKHTQMSMPPPLTCGPKNVTMVSYRSQCNETSGQTWFTYPTGTSRARNYCVYSKGCSNDYYWYSANEIREFLDERFSTIVGMALGVAVCLGFGLIFTIMLCCILRRSTIITVN